MGIELADLFVRLLGAVFSLSHAAVVVPHPAPSPPPQTVASIRVSKSDRMLELRAEDGSVLGSFHVAIGAGGPGHKRREGDFVTPVGRYHVVSRSPSSEFKVFLRLDYPNAEDRARFAAMKARGELPRDAAIGNEIGIHGGGVVFGSPARDWTLGCVRVDTDKIIEIDRLVRDGTVVEIAD